MFMQPVWLGSEIENICVATYFTHKIGHSIEQKKHRVVNFLIIISCIHAFTLAPPLSTF